MSVDHALDTLLRDNASGLLRTALLLTGNSADAEDLLQDTLLTVHRKRRHVTTADQPVAYLRRMMVNQHLSAQRARKPRTIPLADNPDLGLASAVPGHAEAVAERDAVNDALYRLPVRDRTAVVLRHFLQLETAEIARILDVEASTARSILSRAHASLRDALATTEPDRTLRSE